MSVRGTCLTTYLIP
jgi:hypothetical protein